MAEDLQGLLQRIHDEGIKKTDAQRDQLLADAKRQADELLRQARAEHDLLVAAAQQESAKLVQAGEDKLRQASRDVVIALEHELKQMLTNLAQQCVAKTMSPTFLAELIQTLAKAYATGHGEVTKLELLVPAAQLEELEGYLKTQLAGAFREGLRIAPIRGCDAGLQVSFNGESAFHDFSAETVTELLCAYANPRLLALLRP
jgi:V/A-type H+-transporting ATPase subunit E